jgi:putative FmdB family regulatory protein
MPTYSYVCERGHLYEETRGMSENPKRITCENPECGTKLIRKFTAPAIEFKGTGFNAKRG